MRGSLRCILAGLALGLGTGCHSTPKASRVASAEPGLSSGPIEPGAGSTIVQSPVARPVTFADRHPLFSKPRQYYDNSGNNKIVKAAAATVIGIPAGIVGEIKQIVVGAPPGAAY